MYTAVISIVLSESRLFHVNFGIEASPGNAGTHSCFIILKLKVEKNDESGISRA